MQVPFYGGIHLKRNQPSVKTNRYFIMELTKLPFSRLKGYPKNCLVKNGIIMLKFGTLVDWTKA